MTTPVHEEINTDCIVGRESLTCPEYCFQMEINYSDKKPGKPKQHGTQMETLVALWKKPYVMVCIIISALMNTCGGVLTLKPKCPASDSDVDGWQLNLKTKLGSIPAWIFRACVTMLTSPGQCITMYIKKAPTLVTYNTNMYVRGPSAESRLADISAVAAILQTEDISPTGTLYDPWASPCKYGDIFHAEDKWTEYKEVTPKGTTCTADEVMKNIKQKQHQMFSLPNNMDRGRSDFVSGIENGTWRAHGLILPVSEQIKLLGIFTTWVEVDDEGNPRMWGKDGHKPVKGKDWDMRFVAVTGHPDGQDRVLIVISFTPCRGGMFVSKPEWYVIHDDGKVEMPVFAMWKKHMLGNMPVSNVGLTTAVPVVTSSAGALTSTGARPKTSSTPIGATPQTAQPPTLWENVKTNWKKMLRKKSSRRSAEGPSSDQNQSHQDLTTYVNAVSWSDGRDWAKDVGQADVQCKSVVDVGGMIMKLEHGLTVSPSTSKIESDTEICTLLQTQCADIPGHAIIFNCGSCDLDVSLSIPTGHLQDILILQANRQLALWCCLKSEGDERRQMEIKTFAYELCRVIKKKKVPTATPR